MLHAYLLGGTKPCTPREHFICPVQHRKYSYPSSHPLILGSDADGFSHPPPLHSAFSHLPLLLVCWSVARKLAGRNEPPRGTSLPRAATTSLGGAPFSRVMSNGYSLHFPFLLLYLRLRQLQAPALASRLVGISRCQEGFSISVPPSPRFSLFIPRGFFIVFPPHHSYIHPPNR